MGKKTKYSKKAQKSWTFNFYLLPAFLIFAFLPLILMVYLGTNTYHNYPWSGGASEFFDLYLHGKVIFFEILSVVMAILLIYGFVKKEKAEQKEIIKLFWPMAIYFVLIILSTIFSVSRYSSIYGDESQMEPFIVLLGYSLTACYIFIYVRDDRDISIIYTGAFIGGLFVAGIGIFQMFGINIINTELVKKIITPDYLLEIIDFKGNLKSASSTLYNQDYVGPFVNIYFPLCLSAIFAKTKLWQKIMAGIASTGLIVFLLGSKSKTGIIILAVTALIIIILMIRPVAKYWFIIIPGLSLIVAIFATFLNYKDPSYLNRIRNAITITKTEYAVSSIDTTGNCVNIRYLDHELEITYDFDPNLMLISGPVILDNGKKIPITKDDNQGNYKLTLEDTRTIDMSIGLTQERDLLITFTFGKNSFTFTKDGDNYLIYNKFEKKDESYVAWKALYGYEKAISGRGYIWRITVPRLLDHIFIGAGPDCFPHGVFNKGNDYAVFQGTNYSKSLFTRPHNYYLQVGIETGVLSLVMCLLFFVTYLIDCLKMYAFKKPNGPFFYTGVGCMASVLGFLGTGIANDSMIVITPCFWSVIGLGMVINSLRRKVT